MHGIHNNFTNLQINQLALEQAAIQAAKNQQASRARAETAEEILKQQKIDAAKPDSNGRQKSTPQGFKKILYSKDGITQTNSEEPPPQSNFFSHTNRIDLKI